MVDYLKRFQAMVNDLRARPYIDVHEFSFDPPAPAKELAAVEDRLGAPLAGSLRSFYEQANGLRLRWGVRADLSPDEVAALRKKGNDYRMEVAESDNYPFARINFISLYDSIVKRDWKELMTGVTQDRMEFGGASYETREFSKRVKPFDLFSLYWCMAFLIEPGHGDPAVVLLSDYYAEWDKSRVTDFGSYLEMLLATRGIVESRDKIYGKQRGDLMRHLITGQDYWKPRNIPKLFREP